MPDIGIIIDAISIDEEKVVADQLIKSSHAVDYYPDQDDNEFLTSIAGLLWKDLNPEQKKRVIQWLVADLVYTGTVDFDYTTICPETYLCPTCYQPMDIFDEDENGPRYVCNHCEHIISITPLED